MPHPRINANVTTEGGLIVWEDIPFLSAQEWREIVQALRLSPRESQIAACVVADKSEGDIATMLSISTHTVHSYLERLYRKTSVRSRCQLLIRIFEAYVRLRTLSRTRPETGNIL